VKVTVPGQEAGEGGRRRRAAGMKTYGKDTVFVMLYDKTSATALL
jgi:hypothetical protein